MNHSQKLFQGCLGILALAMAVGCAPASYVVTSPAPSGMKYEAAAENKAQISVIDERQPAPFSSGRLPAELVLNGAPLDPVPFLSKNLAEELRSRGLAVESIVGDNGLPKLRLKTYSMLNHRANGFSPFVTFTFLSADLETSNGSKRIGVFIKRGKVPVGSFQEVVEPTFNQPLAIGVRELSSKVANELFNYRASDAKVNELIAKVSGPRKNFTYMDVYELGFTNSPLAVDKLVELTKDADEYVRIAAISSLGNLRATAQLPLLKSIYESKSGLWQDRVMALKAIADMGTDETRTYIAGAMKTLESAPKGNDKTWTSKVLSLYLQ